MSLSQLVYVSRNRSALTERKQLEELRAILSVSRRNNARDDITGFLLLDKTCFAQILEGERARVLAAYARIGTDPRHGEITLLALRDIRVRSFPHWSMGGAIRASDQQEIYLSHGIGERMDPARLTAPTLVALAMDLQDYELTSRSALQATG